METDEIIRNIKKELRANMNGVASKYMRENGLEYRLNFGIELPRLQDIAREFQPDRQVAQCLWNEQVRESKILAALLMPAEEFCAEMADIWVDEIPNPEVAQLTVLHLFSRLPFAPSLAFEWTASASETRQLCGLLLINRLLINGAEFSPRALDELRDQLTAAQSSPSLPIRKAALNALSRL